MFVAIGARPGDGNYPVDFCSLQGVDFGVLPIPSFRQEQAGPGQETVSSGRQPERFDSCDTRFVRSSFKRPQQVSGEANQSRFGGRVVSSALNLFITVRGIIRFKKGSEN